MGVSSSSKTQHGEKPYKFLSLHYFLEKYPMLTYKARALTENNFIVKKSLVQKYLDAGEWVLDLACGEGFTKKWIQDSHYVGIDLSENVLHRAKRIHQDSKAAYFMKMDGRKLAFQDNSFEHCIAMDVFHHIRDEDLEPMLAEIQRVLKPEGTFLVTDPMPAHFFKEPIFGLIQSLDRGDSFRSPDKMLKLLGKYFLIEKHFIEKSGISRWQIYVLSKI